MTRSPLHLVEFYGQPFHHVRADQVFVPHGAECVKALCGDIGYITAIGRRDPQRTERGKVCFDCLETINASGDARLVEPSYSDADKIPDDAPAKRAARKKKKLIPPPLEAIPGGIEKYIIKETRRM